MTNRLLKIEAYKTDVCSLSVVIVRDDADDNH